MSVDQKASDSSLTEEETARRANAALRRALNTPPQPKHGKVKESKADQGAAAKKSESRRGAKA